MIRFVFPALALILSACVTAPDGGSCPSPTAASATGIYVEAIEGPPTVVAEAFQQAFASDACARRLPYGFGAQYSVHGYLSVVASPAGTLFIYVFDVLDGSRNRVTRVSGQISSATVTTDAWSVVASTMIAQAVTETLDDIAAWIAANGTGA
jgi:hypothetical protein